MSQPTADPNTKASFSTSSFVLLFLTMITIAAFCKAHGLATIAMGTACCSVVLIVTAKSYWEFHRTWWFWVALSLSGFIAVPLIYWFPWNDHYMTGAGAMAACIPLSLVSLGLVHLASRLFANKAVD